MHRNVQVRFGGGVTANPSGRTYPTLRFSNFYNVKISKLKPCIYRAFLYQNTVYLSGMLFFNHSIQQRHDLTTGLFCSVHCIDNRMH